MSGDESAGRAVGAGRAATRAPARRIVVTWGAHEAATTATAYAADRPTAAATPVFDTRACGVRPAAFSELVNARQPLPGSGRA